MLYICVHICVYMYKQIQIVLKAGECKVYIETVEDSNIKAWKISQNLPRISLLSIARAPVSAKNLSI